MLYPTVRLLNVAAPFTNCINKNRNKQGAAALSQIIRRSTDQVVGFAKDRYTGKKAAGNIARDLSMLKTILNVEKKEVPTSQTTLSVNNTTSQVVWIGSPGQGTSGSQRDGDSIKLNRIDLNLLFFWGTGTTNTIGDQIFGYHLVKYKKTPSSGGSTPFAIGDFLNVDQDGAVTPMSLPNTDLAENFDVLHSGQLLVEASYATATNNVAYRMVTLSVECSFHQTFTGSAAFTLVDNAVFVVFTALQPTNTGGTSGVKFMARLWYVDN